MSHETPSLSRFWVNDIYLSILIEILRYDLDELFPFVYVLNFPAHFCWMDISHFYSKKETVRNRSCTLNLKEGSKFSLSICAFLKKAQTFGHR